MKVRKCNRFSNKSGPYYIELSNKYSLLAQFLANPSQTDKTTSTDSQFRIRSVNRLHTKKKEKINKYMYANNNNDKELIDAAITLAEDERTARAKNDITNVKQVTIDASHTATHKNKTTIR